MAGLQIDMQPKDNYLYVKVEGSYNLETAKSLLIDALDFALECNLNRILVDFLDMEGQANMAQTFDYVLFLTTLFRKKVYAEGISGMRMVYVGHDRFGKFGEMVASNRGVTGKSMTDIDEAISWLTHAEV